MIELEISKSIFNAAFFPYLENDDRVLIFYGGAGSGKSYYVAQRYIYRLLTRSPLVLLIVRQTAKTNRDSTFALLTGLIKKWGVSALFTVNKTDMRINCVNGNQVIFCGLDDAEKVKSITGQNSSITDIWVEEASEIEEADYNQLFIRQRGGKAKKQIVLTFNPIDVNHWIKRSLMDTGKATVLKTTYKDNSFIDDEYRRGLEAFKDTDPYYYNVYCLGEWGVYGKSIFDANRIAERLSALPAPVKVGEFSYDYGRRLEGIKFSEGDGCIKIYKEPQPRTPYVIGADTAGEGSDYFAAHVLDNTSGEQVATVHYKGDEDIFAQQLYCLGQYYNNALIGIEANFSTYPIKELSRLGCDNQYIREREDTFTGSTAKAYGFKTTSLTRPAIIAEAVKVVRENVGCLNDRATLEELLTFVRNEKGRPEAANGAHDDLVMSWCIALKIREQQRFSLTPETETPFYNFEFERPQPSPIGAGEREFVI